MGNSKLKGVVANAEGNGVITKEEAGFAVSLVNKFRSDIEKKVKQLHVLQGEIAQLKSNELIIIDLIKNMVAAAERDITRQETIKKLKAAKELNDKSIEDLKE